MKRVLCAILCGVILTLSVPTKSHALVGLLIKRKTVMIVGGATTGTGFVFMGIARYVAAHSTAFLAGLGWGLSGLALGALGIVVLEDETAEFKFPVMTEEKAQMLGVSLEEMEIYNSELNKLNRVKEIIEEEVSESMSMEEVKEIWTDSCEFYLSPATCFVKGKVADEIMQGLRVIK